MNYFNSRRQHQIEYTWFIIDSNLISFQSDILIMCCWAWHHAVFFGARTLIKARGLCIVRDLSKLHKTFFSASTFQIHHSHYSLREICTSSLELLLLTVSNRKCKRFSLILLCKNRFGSRSELAKSMKSIETRMSRSQQCLELHVKVIWHHFVERDSSCSTQWNLDRLWPIWSSFKCHAAKFNIFSLMWWQHESKILKEKPLGSKDVRACCGRFCFVTNFRPLTTSCFDTCSVTEPINRTSLCKQHDDY